MEAQEASTKEKKSKTASKKSAAAKKLSNSAAVKETAAALNRSTRNKDADGNKAKKADALAKLREEKAAQTKVKAVESGSESDLDYGSSEDSDEDYEESGVSSKKRWGAAKSQQNTTSRISSQRLSDSSSDEEDRIDEEYVEADLEDFRKVTISRHRLSLWCNEPYFSKIVVGAFVRISIGFDQGTKKPCYRLCKIERVESRNEYKFPKSRDGKQVSSIKLFLYT